MLNLFLHFQRLLEERSSRYVSTLNTNSMTKFVVPDSRRFPTDRLVVCYICVQRIHINVHVGILLNLYGDITLIFKYRYVASIKQFLCVFMAVLRTLPASTLRIILFSLIIQSPMLLIFQLTPYKRLLHQTYPTSCQLMKF